MPCYLSEWEGSAINRKAKFIRAVDSFLNQSLSVDKKELIIISDGCNETVNVTKKRYSRFIANGTIKLLELPDHYGFQGITRQKGIDVASGEIICNLDSDDYFIINHLANIYQNFNTDRFDWVYFNNIVKPDNVPVVEYYQDAQPMLGKLCNGNIAWKKGLDVTWNHCNGLHDNQDFIAQLITKYPKTNKKIYGCGYVICHVKLEGVQQ